MMGTADDVEWSAMRAWEEAFVLPAFDVDRPYTLQLDNEGDRQKPRARAKEVNVECVDNNPLSIHGKDGVDDVLARFARGEKHDAASLGRLPHNDAGLLEAYDIVEGDGKIDQDTLSPWPRSWLTLGSERPDALASGPGTTPQDIERVTSRKIDALTQWSTTLIKKLSLSDFEADATDDDDDEEIGSDVSHTRAGEPSMPWVPPSASIVPSLWAMGQGHASDNFTWSEDDVQFIPGPIEALPRGLPSIERAQELIPGLSNVASRSLMRRFLIVGTLQRRLWWRVSDIRNGIRPDTVLFSDADAPGELYALAGGMSNVLAWTVDEISRCSRVQGKGTLHAWASLDGLEVILRSLAEMLRCDMTRKPPFPPLLDARTQPSSSSTKQSAYVISLVYTHLVAAVESCASAPLVAILRYLLDLVTNTWRKQLVNWIGWPCGEADRLVDEVEVRMSIGREARRDGRQIWRPKEAEVDRCEPWAGIEVEWGWDERGELDVGYILRPVRLPTFLPIAHARDLLEAGRALRLLQRAAPEGHPLLTMRDRMRDEVRLLGTSRRALDVPTWRYDAAELTMQDAAVKQCIRDARREVAAWRRYKERAAREGTKSRLEYHKLFVSREEQQHEVEPNPSQFSWSAKRQGLEDALAAFDHAPDQRPSPDEVCPKADTLLQSFFSHAQSEADAALAPVNTTTSLIAPMLQWSRLVNASLVSVFFRDLHLGEYLDVCREFLLLGNPQFAARVAEVLLDDGSKAAKAGLVDGVGLSEVLRGDTAWPPGGSELATTLNTAVLDSIATSRAQAALVKRVASKHGTGSDKALLDLDDRLSFSITSAATTKGQADRQSIRALDWLTISFQPPPLIAPLITLQVQLSYQRLFRFLLHLMRVDAVLKGVFRQLMARPQPTCPRWMDGLDVERASRFRYEAHHFVAVLFRHATDVIIRQRWHVFRSRLNALRRSAESQDDAGQADEEAAGASTAAPPSESGVSEGFDAASDVDVGTDDGATDAGGVGGGGDDEGGSMPQQFALKDVFSIAAYHERTLDRMLSGCFLKTRQSVIMTIMLDLFDMILAFGQMLQFVATDDEDDMGNDDGTEKSMSLALLLARFQSKMRLLLQALDIVGQRAMDRGAASVLAGTPQRLRQSYDPPAAKTSSSSSSAASQHQRSSSGSRSRHTNRSAASSARRHAAVDAEIARQEAETRRDLEELERNERKGSMGDLEMIQALIAALQSRAG